MATIKTLRFVANPAKQEQSNAASLSLRSIFDVLEVSRCARECAANFFPAMFKRVGDQIVVSGKNVDDLFTCEPVTRTANGAVELEISFGPSHKLVKFVAAICSNGHCNLVDTIHGWPILSVGCCLSTVTEPDAACNGRVRGGAL